MYDPQNNKYYTKGDCLYVDTANGKYRRLIGRLTVNINTGICKLHIKRKPTERIKMGWLVSAFPLFNMPIDTVILIEEPGNIYMMDWANYKTKLKPWRFTPVGGFEEQILLPDAHWTDISPNKSILIS